MSEPMCGKCGKAMTPDNARIRPELFLHDECLPEELKPQTTVGTCSTGSPEPKTREEAKWFHDGFISGLTVYAREKGDSTLKRQNDLLRRLMDEQGQKTGDMWDKISATPLPDWRIGLLVKPKLQQHALFGERGTIIQVHPSGFGNVIDKDGVVMVQMQSGDVILDKSDNWITA